MTPTIQISKLNDFTFCPNSIYLHSIYESFEDSTYKQTPQTAGKLKHESIDTATYSSAKRYLQGIPVYSEKYMITGKIDIYDREQKALIERKAMIKKVYSGYRLQLYAQYYCMIEQGYEIDKLFLHSLDDNKRYPVELPGREEERQFEKLLRDMHRFYWDDSPMDVSASKCSNCIYNTLCHYAKSS